MKVIRNLLNHIRNNRKQQRNKANTLDLDECIFRRQRRGGHRNATPAPPRPQAVWNLLNKNTCNMFPPPRPTHSMVPRGSGSRNPRKSELCDIESGWNPGKPTSGPRLWLGFPRTFSWPHATPGVWLNSWSHGFPDLTDLTGCIRNMGLWEPRLGPGLGWRCSLVARRHDDPDDGSVVGTALAAPRDGVDERRERRRHGGLAQLSLRARPLWRLLGDILGAHCARRRANIRATRRRASLFTPSPHRCNQHPPRPGDSHRRANSFQGSHCDTRVARGGRRL